MKLPSKYMLPATRQQKDFNEIVTYLAELTEVVEGKQGDFPTEEFEAQAAQYRDTCIKINNSNLKRDVSEYLITLKKEAWFRKDIKTLTSYEQALSDVEAIINRLMP